MIKYIGFIKEYNNIEEAIPIFDVKNNQKLNDEELIENIIDYLDKGEYLFGWMSYIIDIESDQPLVPDCYYTDGVWIWPEYFKYYLRKYLNFPVNEEFIEYVKSNNFKIKNKINIKEIEEVFMDKLSIK